jgi:hypothetical protein
MNIATLTPTKTNPKLVVFVVGFETERELHYFKEVTRIV